MTGMIQLKERFISNVIQISNNPKHVMCLYFPANSYQLVRETCNNMHVSLTTGEVHSQAKSPNKVEKANAILTRVATVPQWETEEIEIGLKI